MNLFLRLLVFFFILIVTKTNAQRFVHPGIPFTKYDLDQLKANITKEPWLSAYNAFKEDYRSKLTYTGSPRATVTRAPNLNNTVWINDMIAVHHLAFMWIFTGDSAYARRGTDILDAWAVTNTVWGGNESMLDIGDYTQCWATGADILRGTFPGWTESNTVHVKNYFANVLYPTAWVPYPLRDANKGALQLKIALAAAAFLDDATKFNHAIDVYRMDAGGGMRNSLTNGEVGDAGRDDHWRVQAAALVWGAEVAYKQGIDMYEELDKRVLAIGELYNRYSFEGDTMTYIPTGGYASFWTNWGIPTGYKQGDYTNILHGAYKLRKGIPTPYNDRMRAVLMQPGATWYSPAGGDFLYLKSSDTSTATVLPPIHYPAEHVQPVTHLTNVDIGNPGIAGSASYNNGVWTVKAAGNSTSSAFNFNFKKMSGDAGLVVKVNSMSLSSSGCGVMIRQSLAPGSTFYDIYLAATGGVGRHWQPKAPWWLKIERVGSRIFTYHSPDGVNWTGLGCWYSPMGYASDLYYGFYTLSNNTSALNTAVFTNVGFSQAAPAGSPEISSATSATATVGSPFNYTITASGSPATYSASGLPAGLSIDAATGVISGTPAAMGRSEVTISATNAIGTGTATLIVNVINSDAPPAPDSLTASVVNTTQIKLTWSAAANATTYSVKRSQASGGPYTTIQTGVTATNFIDAIPVPEVNNYYVVTALTGDKESVISNEVFAAVPPAIPGKPVVINKNGQLNLTWDTAYGASSYKVKRSLTPGGPYTVIAQVSANSYSDSDVTNGTGYYYVISSVGGTSESANSLESFGVPGSNSSTWSLDPNSQLWSEAGNWMENSVPQSPAIITFKSTADSVLTNDLTGLEVSRMLFDTTASGYTINGNSFSLKTDLVNTSSYTQTITAPITINDQVNVTASSTIKYTGIFSGAGSLTKYGSGVLHLSAQNTYSGNTILNGAVAIAGTGTGTSGVPVSGALGTGKIIMNGGTIWSGDSMATIYNDIEVVAGKRSYLLQTVNGISIYGRLTGSGTLWEDGNDYAGINLYGDNSGFTGTFVAALRSGRNRVRFQVPEAGSANAFWNLDANGIDCIGISFKTGTLHFGALTGRGYIRNNAGGTPTISIGALNQSTWFNGTLANYFDVVKVGSGTLLFGGNHTYWGTTTIKNGTFLLNNSSTNGAFASPIIDSSGTLGGTGLSQASATIGTGTAAKAYLAPGDGGIGTLAVAGLTLNSNGTYNLEISSKKGTADKMKASAVSLAGDPVLSITDIDTGSLALGTNFSILENTGTNVISGTFKDLPEMSIVKVGSYDLRITYKGGDGNDLVLMDERATPMIITSAKADTALIGRAYQYTITGIKSPRHFNASGLPSGLSVDTTTGVISGTPAVYGNFNVVITAANDTLSGSDTLRLVVLNNVSSDITVAEGDTKVVVEWNSILNFTYKVKRSTSSSGPFTVIGNTSTARYTDSLLTNGTTYYYTVTAIDGSTEYPESAPVAATPKLGQWGYWKFNEASGIKAFDSWGARHGTLTGGASFTTGLHGKAVQLNGSNRYVALPAGLMAPVNDFTIAGWVKLTASSTWARLFDFGTGTTNYMFLSPVSGANTVRYAIKVNGGAEQQINSTSPLPAGEWHHVAVTLSGSVGTLYIDGVAVGTHANMSNKPSSLGITDKNYIGRSQFSADAYLNSIVDEFRIYNRALTAAELKTVYTEYAPPLAPTNLVVTTSNSKPAVSWTASSGATSYNVKRAGSLAGPYTTIGAVSSASYTDTAAAGCATYFYVVSATNSNGESGNSVVTTLAGKKLAGTVIGTDGSFNGNGRTRTNAVDGNLSTYFDGPTANGVWVGYDLGADSTQVVYKVRYAPRPGFASRMTGGVFQGSTVASFSTATTLFTITATPADSIYTERTITGTAAYRYIRYLSPNGGYANVAEVEFYGIPSAAVPQITSKAGTKNLVYGSAFSYAIPATNTNNYSATGLPAGLNLDPCTGVISGTLNAAGTFPVILTASGTLGSARDTMRLVVYQLPTVKTKNIQTAVDENGHASITPQQVDDGSISYSGELTLSLDKTNFTCADIGTPVTVMLTGTDADGHTDSATALITVTDSLVPIVTAPQDSFFCYSNGGTYTIPSLTATDNCGVSSVSYVVSGATARSGAGANASGAFNSGISTILWSVTDVYGNVTTDTTLVTVNTALSSTIPDVYAMNPAVDVKNTIYIGYGLSSLTISAIPQGGSLPYRYLWNTGDTTASISVSTAGNFTVTVTDSKGCITTAAIVMKTLDVRCGNNNNKVMICHNKKTICIANDDVQDHLHHGDYLGGCTEGARLENGATADNGNAATIAVYPNPVHEMLTIQLGALNTGAVMQLYNASGVLVKTERLLTSTTLLSVRTLPAGVYYIRIQNGGNAVMRKIVRL